MKTEGKRSKAEEFIDAMSEIDVQFTDASSSAHCAPVRAGRPVLRAVLAVVAVTAVLAVMVAAGMAVSSRMSFVPENGTGAIDRPAASDPSSDPAATAAPSPDTEPESGGVSDIGSGDDGESFPCTVILTGPETAGDTSGAPQISEVSETGEAPQTGREPVTETCLVQTETDDTTGPVPVTEGQPVHVCSFGEWVTVKKATCTRPGEKTRSCACGKTETVAIPAGHTVVTDKAVPATCLEPGLTKGSHCSVCGAVIEAQVQIPKSTEHSYEYLHGSEDLGNAVYACKICGALKEVNETASDGSGLLFGYFSKSEKTCRLIGYGTFSGTKVVIPSEVNGFTVNQIYPEALAGNPAVESIVVPSTVTLICRRAFADCPSLRSVELRSDVSSSLAIQALVFSGCQSLKEITIPGSVFRIDADTFRDSSLEKIVYRSDVGPKDAKSVFFNLKTIREITFSGSKVPAYICSGATGLYKVVFGGEVGEIGEAAFSGCTSLSSVSLPDGLAAIGADAFRKCTSLKEVTVPDSVKTLSSGAFASCTALERAVLPAGITAVADSLFYACGSLKDLELPATLTSVGNKAFYACYEFDPSIPSGVVSIGGFAFSGTSLSSVTVPDGGKLGEGAFRDCKKLKNVTIGRSGYTNLKETFYGCSSLESVTVPEGVLVLTDTFSNCSSLKTVVLPDGLLEITGAFSSCVSLRTVSLPGTLTVIGRNAFCYCGSLTELVLPDGVNSIGDSAFSFCGSLERMILPAGLTTTEYSGREMFRNCVSLKEVVVPDGIRLIPERAFWGCSSLERVVLPESLISIGANAFDQCSSMKEITIPSGVKTISPSAFSSCTSLDSVTIPGGISNLSQSAFWGCTSLRKVVIGEGLKSIDEFAFRDCHSLSEVSLPGTLTHIGLNVFGGCPSLSVIDYDGTVKEWVRVSVAVNDFFPFTQSVVCTDGVVVPEG